MAVSLDVVDPRSTTEAKTKNHPIGWFFVLYVWDKISFLGIVCETKSIFYNVPIFNFTLLHSFPTSIFVFAPS